MAKALENPGTEPTYLEFFGFTRPPFARLSQPSQIFHTEQYSLLMAHLAAATEQSDCLVVVCGADGSGKTTLLNRYLTSLGDDVCFASIDDSCNGEKEFFCAFLRQLGFSDITGTSRELWRITKEFLVHRGTVGEPVMMIIDNAHLIKPNILEQLRRMSAIKVNDRRVMSVVLAGTTDLNRIIDSPAMSEVQFHSQVHFNIRVYTEEETANYVWHRLRLAGGSDVISFSNDAHPLIYRYTGGIPKLINMLCNELLTEALQRKSHDITEELVRAVAGDRKLLPHVVPLQGKGRRKTDPDFKLVQADGVKGERITPRDSAAKGVVEKPKPRAEKPDAGDVNLLEQISELSAQVGELRADRMKALEEIDTRDKDNTALRGKLDSQTAEIKKLTDTLSENTGEIERLKKSLDDSDKALRDSEKSARQLKSDLQSEKKIAKEAKAAEARGSEKLAGLLEEHEDEIARLKKALSDNMKALQQSEKTSDKLTTELEKERKALHTAEADGSNSRTKAEVLDKENAEFKKKIDKLAADLKEAEARDASHLEAEIEKKEDELATLRDELESRDDAISELEKEFKVIQKECASLRLRVAARKTLEDSVSAKEARIADLQAELDSQSEEIEQLKLKYAGVDADDVESSRAEQLQSLETGIREARKMLTGMHEQLSAEEAEFDDEDTGSQEIPGIEVVESDFSLESGEHEFLLRSKKRQIEADKADEAAGDGGEIASLEVFHDSESMQQFKFPAGESRIMIGRSEDSELRLKSEFVSRHHALIIRAKDGLYIEDLNSFNGTIVNSEKISRCKLNPGDVIMIGRFEIKPRTE